MYCKSYDICLIVMARVTFMLPYMCSNYGCLSYSCTQAVSIMGGAIKSESQQIFITFITLRTICLHYI